MNNEHSLNFPIYPETCKNGQQSVFTCHFSLGVFPGENPVVCILPPQTAKTDVAVMFPENTVLPKTFHPTDELAAQWKRTEPEGDLSQPGISSV